MNDHQLIDALRAIGTRPAMPSPSLAEHLWDELARRHAARRPTIRRELLFVAGLLFIAALALVIAVGSNMFHRVPLVVDASSEPSFVAPAPSPQATPSYAVDIPAGLALTSTAAEAEAAARAFRDVDLALTGGRIRIIRMAAFAPGVEVPDLSRGWTSRADPVWAVEIMNADNDIIVLYIADGSMAVVGTDLPDLNPEPEGTFAVVPAWDPEEPVQLISSAGRTLPASVVSTFTIARGTPSDIVQVGDALYTLITRDDVPVRLVRIELATGATTTLPLPDVGFGSLVAGRDRLWLDGDDVYSLDPVSGDVVAMLPKPHNGTLLAEDAEGLWFRLIGGIALTHPTTGATIRTTFFTETGTHSYTGFWSPPMFGSLWDVDRGTGVLHRFDRFTGATQATILAGDCSDPAPVNNDPSALEGLAGVPGFIVLQCADGLVLVDPVTNAVFGSLPDQHLVYSIGGSLWAPRQLPTDVFWWHAGSLDRVDPASGAVVETIAFNRPATSGMRPFVAGGDLLLLVSTRTDPQDGSSFRHTLIRVPAAELSR